MTRVPKTSPLCLEGGIAAAMGADPYEPKFRQCQAFRSVHAYLGMSGVAIYPWNDNEDRTASEVIEVLRACAVIEASRERESAEVSA